MAELADALDSGSSEHLSLMQVQVLLSALQRASESMIDILGCFLLHRKFTFLCNKNAPRGSHCGELEDVASATRRRREAVAPKTAYALWQGFMLCMESLPYFFE